MTKESRQHAFAMIFGTKRKVKVPVYVQRSKGRTWKALKMVKLTITCKGDCKVTKKHQSTIQHLHVTSFKTHKQAKNVHYVPGYVQKTWDRTRKNKKNKWKTSENELTRIHKKWSLIKYINQTNNANTCQHTHILVFQIKTRIKLHKHRLPVSNSTPKNGQNGNDSQGRLQSHKKHQKTTEKNSTCMQHHQLEYVDKQQFKA